MKGSVLDSGIPIDRRTNVYWINPTDSRGRVNRFTLGEAWSTWDTECKGDRQLNVFVPDADPEDANWYRIRASELFLTSDDAKAARVKTLKKQDREETKDMVKTLKAAGYKVINAKGKEL